MSDLSPGHEIVERALAAATRTDGTIVIVEDASDAELRFALNSPTTNGTRRTRTVTVVSLREHDDGNAAGVVSRSGEVDLDELVRAAESAALTAPIADDAAPLVGAGPVDSAFDEPPVLTTGRALAGVLEGLAACFPAAASRATKLAGFAEQRFATTYLGTSAGARLRHVQPTARLEMVARSDDGERSAWSGVGTDDLSSIDVAVVDGRLTERLGWAGRHIDLDAGRYEVVLPPDTVADLMLSFLYYAGSGREAEDGSSVFSAPGGRTRIGDVLSPRPFVLRSDPSEPGLECAPFVIAHSSDADTSVFDNGLTVSPTRWIDEGRLARLLYHRAGAERSSSQATPPVDNLLLELPGASGTTKDLVERSDRALLVTCFWYIRELDPVTLLLTGLTRDGVYLVEKGEIVGAVNNFRFNESPVDVLARAIESGATERALGREWSDEVSRTAMPPLRIAEFNMSSVSPAT